MTSISTLGAIAALVVAIVLILRKVSPAYGMMAGMAGALVGGLT
ncbi:D-glycerate transporter [Salmonella enterica subsp. enterica serovar Johannesburg str. S5-703]|nr:D-glycerate transporter [Salmonella enterica subsp. enterica serovar Johannesburg str. S5-703]